MSKEDFHHVQREGFYQLPCRPIPFDPVDSSRDLTLWGLRDMKNVNSIPVLHPLAKRPDIKR